MPNDKIFWVKYIYAKANFDLGPHVDLNKIYPGKFTNNDMPRGRYIGSGSTWKGDHVRVRCASKDDIFEILFDHEHKKQGFKCFIRILRCLELEFDGLECSSILVEVQYKIVITKLSKKGTKHAKESKFMMSLYWATFNSGHIGMVDKEIIAFKVSDDPSEYDNDVALLKRLPPAPTGTKLEIIKSIIQYPIRQTINY